MDSRSRSSHRWAEHQLLELFRFSRSAGKKVVRSGDIGLWWITPVQLYVSLQRILGQRLQNNRTYSKVVEHLPALEDFVQKTTPGRRELRSRPAALT
jgi:hypothetical protein